MATGRLLALALTAAVIAGTVESPVGLPVVRAQPVQERALAAKEATARRKCADELFKLARWCALQRAFDEARRELERGLLLHAGYAKLETEIKRLEGKEPQPRKGFTEKLAAKREGAYAKCVGFLADVARRYDKADLSEPFESILELAEETFPGTKGGAEFGLVYFEAYVKWTRAKDAARLADGWELIDGEWVDAAGVKALDAEHTEWSDPWRVGDDVHEVRTTMSLRTARSVLAHVAAARAFFLEYFDGEWDLRTPQGKLPVIVTATQAELRERLDVESRKIGGTAARPQAAAFYLYTNGSLDPCFVTFEPMMADGTMTKIGFPELLIPLKHEVAHQIAFEYSKHVSRRDRIVEHQFWSAEGVANFLPYYALGEDGWRLTHPKTLPFSAGGFSEGAFAWCKTNRRTLAPIAEFVKTPRESFGTVENYHYAATLAYFLLEGANRVYREGFIKLLAAVHAARDTADLWDKCFPDVEMATMQSEWLAFVEALPLDK